jgi:hypothetical protein
MRPLSIFSVEGDVRTELARRQPTPWVIDHGGTLRDANGKVVRLSGLGTALNATSFFPHADRNRDFMLQAVNRLGRELDRAEAEDADAV